MILQVLVDNDPGLTGNLLVERLVGAHVDLVSKEEYASIGSTVCLPYPSSFTVL